MKATTPLRPSTKVTRCTRKKKALYLSFTVLGLKVLTGDTIFTTPTGIAKGAPSFLSYFKTLGNGPAPGIEPATSRFVVKRPTD